MYGKEVLVLLYKPKELILRYLITLVPSMLLEAFLFETSAILPQTFSIVP